MEETINTSFEPNKTILELHELIKSGTKIDPLRDFSGRSRGTAGLHLAIVRQMAARLS